jgi:hypothetical protein
MCICGIAYLDLAPEDENRSLSNRKKLLILPPKMKTDLCHDDH